MAVVSADRAGETPAALALGAFRRQDLNAESFNLAGFPSGGLGDLDLRDDQDRRHQFLHLSLIHI